MRKKASKYTDRLASSANRLLFLERPLTKSTCELRVSGDHQLGSIVLKNVQFIPQRQGRIRMNGLAHKEGNFVCVMARSWYSNGPWPVVVEVAHFVGQFLHLLRRQPRVVHNNVIM